MVTVRRQGKYRVVIFSNDHRPCHVHVIRGKGNGEASASFWLNCAAGPPILREVDADITLSEVNKIAEWLTAELAVLCKRWSEIHGDF